MKTAAICTALLLIASTAFAQEATPSGSQTEGTGLSAGSIEQLLSQGFEIKAAVPNGSKFIVFLQKEKAAYACEFANVARSKCGALK